MSPDILARWQFGITTVYHYFFVPVTIGLSALVAIMQTVWVRTSNEKYLRLTKFFGKLFLINFAMGVVTGIVQEFQFGMNWSEYSRFVGDVFGAPLALEGLLAFFLESTFLGLWIFGWDRLPKKLHLATIWLASIGTVLSAVFILAANAWMQNPVGATYNPITDRAELTDFVAVLTNPIALITIAHVIPAAWMTAGGLVVAIAGWHLAKIAKEGWSNSEDVGAYRFAAKLGAWTLIVSGLLVIGTGDIQGKLITHVQPMKIAAAEALYEDAGGDGKGAPFAIVAITSLDGSKKLWSIEVPYVLSYLATGSLDGKVEGINNLQAKYATGALQNPDNALAKAYAEKMKAYGIQDWRPYIPVTFWSFRLMIGLGMLAMAIGAWVLWVLRKGGMPKRTKLWHALMLTVVLAPLFANSFAWILTEMGRQPWVVYGVFPTAAANSPGVSSGELLFTMIGYTLIYGTLAVVEIGLLLKYIKLGLPEVAEPAVLTDADAPLTFAY